MNKNYTQWNVLHYMWDSVEDFEKRWSRIAGVHTIQFDEASVPIDIYVNQHVADDGHAVQPVFFTGAVTTRANKKGPFFSGLGITHGKKLPLIAIADASLDEDPSLSLAWYTGGPNDNFIANLTRLLEAIQRVLLREMVFVGGSGGGFAALNIARHFDAPCSILVWNPQTDIYEYSERFVRSFLKSRFNFANSSLTREDWKDFCRIRTDAKISTNVLSAETVRTPRRIAYLQNASDWHREKHLGALWRTVSDTPAAEGMNAIDPDHVVFVKEFAEGHAPPSAKLIASLLSQLMDPSLTVEKLSFDEK